MHSSISTGAGSCFIFLLDIITWKYSGWYVVCTSHRIHLFHLRFVVFASAFCRKEEKIDFYHFHYFFLLQLALLRRRVTSDHGDNASTFFMDGSGADKVSPGSNQCVSLALLLQLYVIVTDTFLSSHSKISFSRYLYCLPFINDKIEWQSRGNSRQKSAEFRRKFHRANSKYKFDLTVSLHTWEFLSRKFKQYRNYTKLF